MGTNDVRNENGRPARNMIMTNDPKKNSSKCDLTGTTRDSEHETFVVMSKDPKNPCKNPCELTTASVKEKDTDHEAKSPEI